MGETSMIRTFAVAAIVIAAAAIGAAPAAIAEGPYATAAQRMPMVVTTFRRAIPTTGMTAIATKTAYACES